MHKGSTLTLLLVLFCFLASSAEAQQRPNVVFLLSDDQGWTDYGFMGHPHIQTPNLDQLAKESVLYERGYVTAPLCRPSLASNIDIATTILKACGIDPPESMTETTFQ